MRRKNVKAKTDVTLAPFQKELARREAIELAESFRAFVEAAWDIVEPGQPFIGGMHVDAICSHMQAAAERRIKKLLINVPPRHSKSTLCSVLFPAWVWARNSHEKFLYASYSSSLAIRDATKSRRLIESDWYKERWPNVELLEDNNLKASYENTTTGTRQTTSVNGTVTGLGGTFLILDDPHNVKDAESSTVREQAVQWFRESWFNRTVGRNTVRIVIMQRVHASDVSAYCESEGDWCQLFLPNEYDGHKKPPTPIGWEDPRDVFGEILWPDRYDQAEVASLKATLTEYAYAAQYQQTPVPRSGGLLKKGWMRFWYDPAKGTPDPVPYQTSNGDWRECAQGIIPEGTKPVLTSWDLAFKGGAGSDFVVGQVWGKAGGGQFVLLAQDRDRRDFPATLSAMRRMAEDHPTELTLVEEAANGAAALAVLVAEIPGLIGVRPEGGKESRAAAMAPLFEAGQVWLPHPDQFPWVDALIAELTMFPRAPNDDQVDCASQAIVRLRERRVSVVTVLGDSTGASDTGLDFQDASWVN